MAIIKKKTANKYYANKFVFARNKPLRITGSVAACTTVIFSYPASLIAFSDGEDTEHSSNLVMFQKDGLTNQYKQVKQAIFNHKSPLTLQYVHK